MGNQADLKSLCEVSKCVSGAARPQLFESITFNAPDNKTLEGLASTMDRFLENLSVERICDTKHIIIKSPFRANLRARCSHHTRASPSSLDESNNIDQVSGRSNWNPSSEEYIADKHALRRMTRMKTYLTDYPR